MRPRTHESNADRQRAYRERQKMAAQQARESQGHPLPFHGPTERAELRALLLEAAELLEKATPTVRKPKRGAKLLEIFDSPEEQQRRKARTVRELADHLGL